MAQKKGPKNFLFVYGSLAPGHPNAHLLAPLKGTWKRGSVKGFLHEKSVQDGYQYYGVELDRHGDNVQGQLFSSPGLEAFWSELDAFEGADFRRVVTEVTLSNGRAVDAFIYELARA